MFNLVLAIDIAPRVNNAAERFKSLSARSALMIDSVAHLQEQGSVLAEVDALLVSIYQELNQESLSALPKLKYLGIMGSSTKKVAVDLCLERGIQVDSVHNYCDAETAEWVIMHMLMHNRVREPPRSLSGQSLGLIGVGAVGSRVASLALALGLQLKFFARRTHPELEALGARASTKEDIFSHAQIISFHTPPHIVWLNTSLLNRCCPQTLLINTCLGKVSADHSLEDFLKERPDITLIMDSIAGSSYPKLNERAQIDRKSAFLTSDSELRLVNKFFAQALAAS